MQMTKKVVSVVIAVMMVVSMMTVMAVSANAATAVAKVGETNYESLEDAIAAISTVTTEYHSKSDLTIKKYKATGTITLLADCEGNGIVIDSGSDLTIDFNGKKYSVTGNLVGSNGTESQGFQLLKDSNVTFKNGTIYSEKAKFLVQNYSNLTLDGMTLTLNNPTYASAYTLSNNNGNTVIEDTTINANPAGGFAFDVCRYSTYPSVSVTVKGDSTVNGNVEVSASGGNAGDGFSLNLESGKITGDVVVDSSATTAMNATPEKATIAQDTTEFTIVDDPAAKIGSTKYETLEEAFAAAADGDTITVLADTTIPTMISTDLTDITLNIGASNITATGWAFKNNGSMTIVGSTGSISGRGIVDNYGEVTFDGGTYNATHDDGGMIVYNNASGDKATFKSGTFTAEGITVYNDGGTVDVNGGTLSAKDTVIYAINGSQNNLNGGTITCNGDGDDTAVFVLGTNTKVVVDGATITANEAFCISSNGNPGNEGYTVEVKSGTLTASTAPAIYQQQDGKLTITGGDITGTSALYIKSGDVTISGGTFTGTQVPATDYEFYGNGTRETGDAIIVDNCNYPGGAPTVSITGGTFTSAAGKAVASYTDKGSKPSATAPGTITGFVSGGNFSNEVPETYCAPGYEPKTEKDPQTGMYTVQVDNNPLNENIGTGIITASQAAAQDGNKFDLPGTIIYTKGRILGVQKKEAIMTDVAGIGIRFIAEAEKATLNDAQEYGFEICKTSKTNTPDFAAADGFAAMADPANSAQIVKVNCKGTSNTVVGGGYGDPSADTAYKYVTLAVNDIPSDQGVAVRFYVKDSSGVTHYAKYVRAGDVNMYDGCCTSYANLG